MIGSQTLHARTRQQQRGKTNPAVNLLMDYYDLLVPTRSGCTAVQMSRKLGRELKSEGFSPQLIDAARRTTMIITANEDIVTIYRSASISSLRKRQIKKFRRIKN